MDDDISDFDDEFEPALPLDEHESMLVQQDLVDLEAFEVTFRAEGYKGVSVWCQDCAEDHFYPWDLLRNNLELLLQTGETPVHEPAFEPDPEEYVPWEYARGYVDALSDVGVDRRRLLDECGRCGYSLEGDQRAANFCPRCGAALLGARLAAALRERGMDDDAIGELLREFGIPG